MHARVPSRVWGEDQDGLFKLCDTGRSTDTGHVLLLVKLNRGAPSSVLSFRPGEVIHIRCTRANKHVRVSLMISFIAPAKYYRAGNKVTSCLIGVTQEAYAACAAC